MSPRWHQDNIAMAIATLKRNDIRVSVPSKFIDLELSKNRPGIGLLGVIDFLCKYHGFSLKRKPFVSPWLRTARRFVRKLTGGGL